MASDIQPIRRALLDLHKVLLHAQKRDREEQTGETMTPGQMLAAAVDDLHFSWLRQMSEVIVELDEARAGEDPDADVPAALDRIRGLVVDPAQAHGFGARYVQVLQKHPEAVEAHRKLIDALEA